MKKIFLIGVAGMAGHVIYTHLDKLGYRIFSTKNKTDFKEIGITIDINNLGELRTSLEEFQPDIIINCVGVLLKGSKDSSANAIFTNAYFPHFLAEYAISNECKLIHISTDCVFSGLKGGYIESDIKDAKDVYGKSKGLGEIIDSNNLTIRTSIIGPELKKNGEGLFDWFFNQKGDINGYTNAFWSGVTTVELAKFIDYAINTDLTGLFHLTNNIRISKFELLTLIKNRFSNNVTSINAYHDYFIDKSLLNTNQLSKYTVPSYSVMLEELHLFMQENNDFYINS